MNQAGDIARGAHQREQGTPGEPVAALWEIAGAGEALQQGPRPVTSDPRAGEARLPVGAATPSAPAAWIVPATPPAPAEGGLRMGDLLNILRRRARLVAAVAVGGALLTGALAALLPPSYVATAQIMVEPAASEVAAGLLAPVVDTHITLLTSEARLRRVFADLAAQPDYVEASAALGAHPPLTERAKDLLREIARELGLASRPAGPEAEAPAAGLGPAQARAAMLVRQERQSSIVSVGFQDRSPQRAALVANRMVTRHVQELGERRTQDAAGRQAYQEERVEEARAEVEEAERAMRAFQIENGGSASDREGEPVSEMTRQLALLRSEVASREREAGAPGAADEVRVLKLQADAIEARLAELRTVHGAAIDRRIGRQALDLRLEAARRRLADQQRQLEESGRPQPAFASSARVVAQAWVPARPSSLHPVAVAVPGLVAFAILGGMVALLRERLARGYRAEREVEEDLGIPCLGLVPRAPSTGAVAGDARAPWGRAVGALVLTLLHRSRRPGSPCVVTVTACAGEEDKAGLATAIAARARQVGLRVLLVRWDDDAALVSGAPPRAAPEDEAAPGPIASAAFGRDPALGVDRPVSEGVGCQLVLGLGGDRSARVRHVLAHDYDLVLVDAPPVLASAQARLVASSADATLLALGWGRTDRKVAAQALRLLRRPMPLAGDGPAPTGARGTILAVLADVDLEAHARYRLGDVGEHLFEAGRRQARTPRAPEPAPVVQALVGAAPSARADAQPEAPPRLRRRAGA